MEAVFEFEKETPNTVRYREIEEDEPAKVGTIYVKKWVLKKLAGNGKFPKRIKITIEVVQG